MDQNAQNVVLAYWRNLDQARPDLTRSPPVPGKTRGIDFYSPATFHSAFGEALARFFHAHHRMPDLQRMPQSCDHFFAMKFFEPIAMSPNPASKLNAALFLNEELADKIRIPKRYGIAPVPVLPPDDAVPAGRYWLKLDLGNAKQEMVTWPPSPQERETLVARMQKWFSSRYGVIWGEWWYGVGEQRIYLEEDLSDDVRDGCELKYFVRKGRPSLYYNVKYKLEAGVKVTVLRYFDEDGNPMEGSASYGVNGTKFRGDYDAPAFDGMDTVRQAVSVIGQLFSLVRVDFFIVPGARPILGEITLCHNNARLVHSPPSFEQRVTKALFG